VCGSFGDECRSCRETEIIVYLNARFSKWFLACHIGNLCDVDYVSISDAILARRRVTHILKNFFIDFLGKVQCPVFHMFFEFFDIPPVSLLQKTVYALRRYLASATSPVHHAYAFSCACVPKEFMAEPDSVEICARKLKKGRSLILHGNWSSCVVGAHHGSWRNTDSKRPPTRILLLRLSIHYSPAPLACDSISCFPIRSRPCDVHTVRCSTIL